MKTILITFVLAACAVMEGTAMPTREETERAEPVVRKLMASERAALESGKKTRSEVAAAAMKLAGEADTAAAKLLLMKGAFVLYVKDGNLEKAVKTMNTLEKAITDLPPQSVTNMIEMALLGVSKKANGARLYRMIDAAKNAEKNSGLVRSAEGHRGVNGRVAIREGKETVDGYTWSYSIRNGGASIEIPGGGYECAVSPRPEGRVVIPSKLGGVAVTRIGRAAFSRCHALTSVTIPATVTSIGMSAFYECRMSSVTIPPGVKEIGELAFYNSSLKSVTIPEGVTSIGSDAFGDCWGMESVSIPSSVTSIGTAAVACGSNRMKSIDVSPGNEKYASNNGLLCTKDGKTVLASVGGEVMILEGVTEISKRAFYKCYGLTSVTIPASVTKIGDAAFEWCDNIELFNVAPGNLVFASPNGLLCSKDGKTVIAGVNGGVAIPDGVISIGELAFSGRRKLTSVTVPSSVKRMDVEVFRCCKGLNSVTMCGERPSAGKGVFDYCGKLKAVHVPANAKSWTGMKSWQGIPLVFDAKLQGVKDRTTVQSIIDGMIKVPGRDCWLSETELTQGQWEAVMGYNLSGHKDANLPVEKVSRDDCDVFLEKLNQTEEVKSSHFTFCLPANSDWRYAARAGGEGNDCWIRPGVVGDVFEMAWMATNSQERTHAVAIKSANAFGFYDMQGNVWEWMSERDNAGRGFRFGCGYADGVEDVRLRLCRGWYTPRHRRYDGCGLRLAAHLRSRVAKQLETRGRKV